MTCVNLEERFGRRYRIGLEAGGATKCQWPLEEWPWLMELLCHHGKVYPKGGDILQAMTDKPVVGAKLRKLPCVLQSRGHEETVVTFHIDHLEQVLAVLKPYRRRQVSEAERARLAEMGERFRFGEIPGVQVASSALESTQIAPDVKSHVPVPPARSSAVEVAPTHGTAADRGSHAL